MDLLRLFPENYNVAESLTGYRDGEAIAFDDNYRCVTIKGLAPYDAQLSSPDGISEHCGIARLE